MSERQAKSAADRVNRVLSRLLLAGLAWLLISVPALAGLGPATEIRHMAGTLGKQPIELSLLFDKDGRPVGASYFYRKYLANIPLVIELHGERIVLTESGGGAFDLHAGRGAGTGDGLRQAVELEGLWRRDAVQLPVEVRFEYTANVPIEWYKDVTDEPAPIFEARVRNFLQAVLSGRKDVASRYVFYPLRVNRTASVLWIHNKSELVERWNDIFPPHFVQVLRGVVPHEMFVREGMASVGAGDAWFNHKGALSLNIQGHE